MRLITWVVGVSITLAGTGCAGRRVATTFSDMEKRVPAGTTVYLTTRDGTEVKGKLVTVSGSSMNVSLRDAATRDFSEADVARISAKDKLWNGLLIGAALGGFFAFMLNDASCIEPYASPDCKKVPRGAGVAITAGIGAALGTAFDALHHRRVFRGTKSTRGASLFIAPVVAPHVAAVRVSARF